MALRTKLFQQLPWTGGVNDSVDEALITPNELIQADHVVFESRSYRKKRDGLKYNFDNAPLSDTSIIGLHEYWFGDQSRIQRLVGITSNRTISSYTSGGTRTVLADTGRPWTGELENASMLTFNNRVIMAVTGLNNTIKKWNGSGAVEDLRNILNQSLFSSGRSSSGTTRTLVLSTTFKGVNGDFIVVSNASSNQAFYNGTYQITSVSTTNVNNDTITYEGPGVLVEAGFNDTALIVDGTAPQGSILREHLGRIWTNDKTNRDRLHYSGSFNHEQWLGFGDSAAIDIGVGDGDPEGIVAIFPTFKGELFVAKRTKLYRISGYSPETYEVRLVSNGIGCVGHNSIVAIDQDDMYFVSEKGIHSVTATANFGDFGSEFISAKIQTAFNRKFSKPRLNRCWAAYLPTINCAAFAFTDTNLSPTDNTALDANNVVWLYNVIIKEWFRWPDVPCESLIVATDGDLKRFYFGSHTGRIIKSFTGNFYDLSYTGERVAIKRKIVTGAIPVDGQYYTVKGFKRFIFYYKADGTHEIHVDAQVDNFAQDPANQFVFAEQAIGETLLGINFILGESALGGDSRLGTFTRDMLGYGRGIQLTIEDEGITQQAEIQGFGIEFEDAGVSPELLR